MPSPSQEYSNPGPPQPPQESQEDKTRGHLWGPWKHKHKLVCVLLRPQLLWGPRSRFLSRRAAVGPAPTAGTGDLSGGQHHQTQREQSCSVGKGCLCPAFSPRPMTPSIQGSRASPSDDWGHPSRRHLPLQRPPGKDTIPSSPTALVSVPVEVQPRDSQMGVPFEREGSTCRP